MANETPEIIIAGAAELFFEHGFSKITVDEIAKHIGITKKTIYNHFPNKLALLTAVVETTVQAILKGIDNIASNIGVDSLTKLENMIDFIYREIGMRRLFFFEGFHQYYLANNEKPVEVIKERIITLIRQLINDSQREGLLRQDIRIDVLPYVYLNMLYGLMELYKTTRVPVHPGQLLIDSLEISFYGILAAKEKRGKRPQEREI